jgi:hypothetical protein
VWQGSESTHTPNIRRRIASGASLAIGRVVYLGNVRRLLLLTTAVLTVACEGRPPEFGVSVFADDTLPVIFTVELTGTLVMGLRSDGFRMRPDKSLVMTTPAQLIINKGAGTATITSLRGGNILVQPLGVKPDSGDTSSALGMVVKLARTGVQRSVKLTVEKK